MKFWPDLITKDVDAKINDHDQRLISRLIKSFLTENPGSKLIDKKIIDRKWDFSDQALEVEIEHKSSGCRILFPKISIFNKENFAYFFDVLKSFHGAFGAEPKRKIVGFRMLIYKGNQFLKEFGFAVPSKELWHANEMRSNRGEEFNIMYDFFVDKEIPFFVKKLNEVLK